MRGVSATDLAGTWVQANLPLIALSLVVFVATPILQGVRLRRLLAIHGDALSLSRAIRLSFAGNFMNFAIPVGSTTGDVYKAALLAGLSSRAVVTTFIDRAIGLGTLLATVALITLIVPAQSPLAMLRPHLMFACLACGVGLAALRWMPWPGRLAQRLVLLERLRPYLRAARETLSARRSLVLAVIDTLGIQLAATLSFLCAAVALEFHVVPANLPAFYALFSAGEIVKAMPGPPQGLGTLEAAYGAFFATWATPAQIVSAAAAIRAINLLCSLPGLVFVLKRGDQEEPSRIATSPMWASTLGAGPEEPQMHEANRKPDVSVFFPCYNEEENVEPTTLAALRACDRLLDDYEIIIVNDGSSDRTGEIADRLAVEHSRVRAVHNQPNRGYGGALQRGIAEAQKSYIFYTDGDGQFDFEELEKVLPLMRKYDIVSPYRMDRQDPIHRRVNAACWGMLVRRLFSLSVRDIDCAFKLFPRRLFQEIELRSEGALIDTEILARAKRRGYTIGQVGVHHYARTAGESTGANPKVILRAFAELWALRGAIAGSASPVHRPVGAEEQATG